MNNTTEKKNSIVIGLTGQSGAGKSTVSKFMEKLSCKVIDADAEARKIMKIGSYCLKRLAEEFGCDIIYNDGSCNRQLLADRAFSSRENTDKLNAITHPFIITEIKKRIDEFSDAEADLIIIDAPQLFESGGNILCSVVVSVTAPLEIRLERIIKRDGISKEKALLRINAQLDEDFFRSHSDFIIDGSQNPDTVKSQTEKIILKLRKERFKLRETQ